MANIFGSLRAVGRIVQVGRLVIIILFFVEKIIKNGADILQLITYVKCLFQYRKPDGFVRSPTSALRCISRHCDVL